MSNDANLYDKYVIDGILANNEFGITEVHNLETMIMRSFVNDDYSSIRELILKGEVDKLNSLPPDESNEEFLDILMFQDQHHTSYIVSVYDSNELWQDPQVIEIFPMSI